MESKNIRNHWESWASEYKQDLRATTKTSTIKKLEINALRKAIEQTRLDKGNVMEVGCGNGFNCLSLAEQFSNFHFMGVDFIDAMIDNANLMLRSLPQDRSANLQYATGDVLDLANNGKLLKEYDIIFTDRCLINLPEDALQLKGIDQILNKLKTGGFFIMIENMKNLRESQNHLRTSVGLIERPAPEFNHFMDEEKVLQHFENKSCELLATDDFGSLHDLILYVITPMINMGELDYNHPYVEAITEFSLKNSDKDLSITGFGQNRLYLFRKNG